jgi:NAD(P)-dependent dehydrogenase (short-subunit alcohol dehydrogenase family)
VVRALDKLRCGCISLQTDTNWKYAPVKLLAYCASKAVLNMFTVQLAYEFRDGSIAVNSVNPGYTATDLNAHSGPQTIEPLRLSGQRFSIHW